MTPPKSLIVLKFDDENRQGNSSRTDKLDTNTHSSMAYMYGLCSDGRKYVTMKNVRSDEGHGHRNRVREAHVSIIF